MPSTLANIKFAGRFSADILFAALAGTVSKSFDLSILFGTADGKINAIIARDLLLTSGAAQTIDLTTGALDPAGQAVAMDTYCGYLLINGSATPGEDVSVGGGSNAIFAAEPIPIQAASGFAYRLNPGVGTTVDGTHKNFKADIAAGTNVPVSLLIFGRQP